MLHITLPAWLQIREAVQWDKTLEVAFFGKTRLSEDGSRLELLEIIVPPQHVAGAHAELAPEDYAAMAAELIARGENPGDWSGLWGHSHANMGTTPSGTDHDTLKEMAAQRNNTYAVGIVVNARDEVSCWIAAVQAHPFLPNQTTFVEYSNVDVTVGRYEDEDIKATVRGWMQERVRKGAKPEDKPRQDQLPPPKQHVYNYKPPRGPRQQPIKVEQSIEDWRKEQAARIAALPAADRVELARIEAKIERRKSLSKQERAFYWGTKYPNMFEDDMMPFPTTFVHEDQIERGEQLLVYMRQQDSLDNPVDPDAAAQQVVEYMYE